jgi:hypothetical protein
MKRLARRCRKDELIPFELRQQKQLYCRNKMLIDQSRPIGLIRAVAVRIWRVAEKKGVVDVLFQSEPLGRHTIAHVQGPGA